MNRGSILLRVDGSASDGMGRVARCLALANALQRRRYQMTFITGIDNPGWPDRIRRFRHHVSKTPHPAGSPEDRKAMLAEIARTNPTVVVTDSSDIDEEYLSAVASRVPLSIDMDDKATEANPSDLVINPTLGKELRDYTLHPQTQLLAGAKYLMIRSEFRRARNVRATEPSGPARVLICLGGGEVGDATARYARALLKANVADKVDAVTGTGKEGKERFDALAEEFPGRITVTADVRDLGIRMTKAHLLVTGGGNTALEAGCVGIPTLMVTQHAGHVMNATWLEELGLAHYLGERRNVDPKQVVEVARLVLEDNFERKAMSRSGRMLIDGRGADRIVTATEVLLCRSRRQQALAA